MFPFEFRAEVNHEETSHWAILQMSKTFIGGAVCREFESEAPYSEDPMIVA